jgi:tryptophan 7-halogenase
MKKVTDVLVVGGGCAGWLAAVNLKVKLPALNVRLLAQPLVEDFTLDALHTTPDFVEHLHSELGIPPAIALRIGGPTWTLGTRYFIGPRDFFDYTYQFQIDTKYERLSKETGSYVDDGPRAFEFIGHASALMSSGKVFNREKDGRPQMMPGRFGYNFEQQRLMNLLQQMAQRVGVSVLSGKLAEAIVGDEGLSGIRLESGETLTANLYVDATGLQSLLLGKALGSEFRSFAPGLACDSALVGSWQRQEPIRSFTAIHPQEAGWTWRIDTVSTSTCGYVFSSAHTTAQQAEAALRAMYPNCGAARLMKFSQGRYDKAWNGNVIGVGSAAGFVEPLAAAGMAVLAFQCHWLPQTLLDCDQVLRPTLIKQFNKRWTRLIEGEREFLGLIYRYNNRGEPFWQQARENSHVGDLELVEKCYQDLGPDSVHRWTLLHESDPFNLEGYFSLLVGLKVPYARRYEPTAEELKAWQMVQEAWRKKAAAGLTVEETLRGFLGSNVAPDPTVASLRTSFKPMESVAS